MKIKEKKIAVPETQVQCSNEFQVASDAPKEITVERGKSIKGSITADLI